MAHRLLALAMLLVALESCGAPGLPEREARREAVLARADAVLDRLHAAAAAADGSAYFALFADDAVFYGTDAAERWTLPDLRAYAEPLFAQGRGWTYTPLERHLFLDATGDTAWFDERLSNAKYGEVRGSGVLVRRGDAWRVAQYNLAFPVPNELAPDLVERIRSL